MLPGVSAVALRGPGGNTATNTASGFRIKQRHACHWPIWICLSRRRTDDRLRGWDGLSLPSIGFGFEVPQRNAQLTVEQSVVRPLSRVLVRNETPVDVRLTHEHVIVIIVENELSCCCCCRCRCVCRKNLHSASDFTSQKNVVDTTKCWT